MKLMMRNWPWLAVLLAAGVICANYLIAQTQTPQTGAGVQLVRSWNNTGKAAIPDAQEAADSARLIDAVNTGEIQIALGILHAHGVVAPTVLDMATRLGKTPARTKLAEPFLKAWVPARVQRDRMVEANAQVQLEIAKVALGYERQVCRVRAENLEIASDGGKFVQSPVLPIVMLDVRKNDPCFIRFFKWYDRNAEKLHSIAVNGPALINNRLDPTNYNNAADTLNALFRLIKARKPDAFVWLCVEKQDNRSDERWLKAMTLFPDGLLISNLRQFHSPFAETSARYAAIVGPEMPLMVSDFCGYTAALRDGSKRLATGLRKKNLQTRKAAEAAFMADLANIGAAAEQNFAQLEIDLQALGYRGISVNWLLLAAIASSDRATRIDKSNLPDSRVGVLDSSLRAKDYDRVISLASNLITNSAPGDMDWMAGKLAEGMAWLSQTPPDTKNAIPALDEVISVDLNDRPGRDHYVLTAVRWRMYAAMLAGDAEKSRALAQWVQNQPFRKDLKAAFLKQYKNILSQSANPSK